jgi:hypothetical protein
VTGHDNGWPLSSASRDKPPAASLQSNAQRNGQELTTLPADRASAIRVVCRIVSLSRAAPASGLKIHYLCTPQTYPFWAAFVMRSPPCPAGAVGNSLDIEVT